jgi:hypothetical protein
MLKALRNAVIAGWALFGAVVLCAVAFYSGLFFLLHPSWLTMTAPDGTGARSRARLALGGIVTRTCRRRAAGR